MPAPPNRRPNVLVVLTDEERAPRWMPPGVVLPARARLAARGVTFRDHHVHTAPCTPSRATLLTGQHTRGTGMFDNVDFGWQPSLPASVPTWGTMLAAAGYTTAYKGKWHLTHGTMRDGDLDRHGFRDWEGPDRHGRPWMGQRQDGAVARQAERWIHAHARDDRPWLLVVSFVNPHDIMLYPRFRRPRVHDWGARLPDNFADDLGTKPAVQRRWARTCDLLAGRVRDERTWRMIANAYVDLQLEVDRHIGRLLDALAASGTEPDTMVVFTSDHGDMAGAHGLRQKGAFVYRETTNVPLVVAGPGVREAAEARGLTAAVDLAPTLCDLAGVAPPAGLPGCSLVPALSAPSTRVRDTVLFTSDAYSSFGFGATAGCRGFLRGWYDGRLKFARYFEPGRQHAPLTACDLELYDTVEDPGELRNLAAEPGQERLVHECGDRLAALVAAEMGDDRFAPLPPSGVWRTVAETVGRL